MISDRLDVGSRLDWGGRQSVGAEHRRLAVVLDVAVPQHVDWEWHGLRGLSWPWGVASDFGKHQLPFLAVARVHHHLLQFREYGARSSISLSVGRGQVSRYVSAPFQLPCHSCDTELLLVSGLRAGDEEVPVSFPEQHRVERVLSRLKVGEAETLGVAKVLRRFDERSGKSVDVGD